VQLLAKPEQHRIEASSRQSVMSATALLTPVKLSQPSIQARRVPSAGLKALRIRTNRLMTDELLAAVARITSLTALFLPDQTEAQAYDSTTRCEQQAACVSRPLAGCLTICAQTEEAYAGMWLIP
jgi:hypothetical protein